MTYRVTYSILKAAEGGWRMADLRRELKKLGVTDIQKDYTPYIGHTGISIPKATDEVEELILRKG